MKKKVVFVMAFLLSAVVGGMFFVSFVQGVDGNEISNSFRDIGVDTEIVYDDFVRELYWWFENNGNSEVEVIAEYGYSVYDFELKEWDEIYSEIFNRTLSAHGLSGDRVGAGYFFVQDSLEDGYYMVWARTGEDSINENNFAGEFIWVE